MAGFRCAALGAFAALATVCATAPAAKAQWADLALVLAIDSSSSVNFYEFNLQMKGIADAFRDRRVHDAIKVATPNGVTVNVVQWSSIGVQQQMFGWVRVDDPASAGALADLIDATPRLVQGGGTSIIDIVDYSIALLGDVPAARKVIDVSGDGRNNMGGKIVTSTPRAVAAGITVNGLAILNEDPLLEAYYQLTVIGGVGSFVIIADDYRDFTDALVIKLIREISGAPMSSLPAATGMPATG